MATEAEPTRSRTLMGAASNAQVRSLQQALARIGYRPGPVDGVYGSATAAAVRHFQVDQGLDADGIVGPATWSALVPDEELRSPLHGPTGGDDVLSAQRALAAAGFEPGVQDGIYGPATASAVRAFQQARGLDPDGMVGPATWDALSDVVLPPPAGSPTVRRVASIPPGGAPLLALTVLADRPVAVVEVERGRIGCVDLSTGNEVGEPLTPEFGIRPTGLSVTASADGPLVVGAWPDGTVGLWSLVEGGLPQTTVPVQPPPTGVTALAREGEVLVAATASDGRVSHLIQLLRGGASPTVDILTQPVLYRAGSDTVLATLDPTGTLVRHLLAPAGERLAVSAGVVGSGPMSQAGPERYEVDDVPRAGNTATPSGAQPQSGFELLLAGGPPAAPVLVTRRGDRDVAVRSGIDPSDEFGMSVPVGVADHLAVGEQTLVMGAAPGLVHRFDLQLHPRGDPIEVPPEVGALAALAVVDIGEDCVIAVLDDAGGLWVWPSVASEPESEWRQPNPTLARDYWTTEDTLGYGAYARAIAEFIQNPNTRPPLTIGIKGPWGAGKTSVMRMVQALLDPPDNPGDADWRFKQLELTSRGRKALSEGEKATPAAVEATTVKTVLDRAAAAPTEQLDLSPAEDGSGGEKPDQAEAKPAADHSEVARPTVWFNPWMYQTGEQLWAGLAHEIITQVTGRLPPGQRERFWLELNLRRVNREALRRRIYTLVFQKLLVPLAIAIVGGIAALVINALGGSVAAIATAATSAAAAIGIGATGVKALLGNDAARALPQMVDGPIGLPGREDLTAEVQSWAGLVAEPDYQTRAGFLYFVQTDMRHVLDLVATPTRPLVVFIDDLDRCSPGVVTQTIEAVNLFLAGQFPHCIFVLAIEPAVVAAHIETAHKDLVSKLEEFDEARGWSRLGWRFLEKIVQLPLALPPPSPKLARAYVLSLFARPAEREGVEADDRIRRVSEAEQAKLAERRAHPRLADLPAERQEVERRAQEQHGLSESEARKVAEDVAVRRFATTFSDEDEDVREAIVAEALALPHRNPREMKRLVNLFRFYALIVNERRVMLGARSQAEVFAQVARLAALANRWPHLLDALGAPGSPTGGPDGERKVVFEDLEDAAAGPEDGWMARLKACGLAGSDGKRAEPDGLREFLRAGTRVGPIARELL